MFDNKEVRDDSVMAPELKKENCRLIGFDIDAKSEALIVHFTHPTTNSKLDHRIFKPSGKNDDWVQSQKDPEEAFKRGIRNAQSNVVHILNRYLDTEITGAIQGETWVEYLQNSIKALQENCKDFASIPCSLKVVLTESQGKWYSGLPKVPDYISTQAHPKQFKETEYDIFHIPGQQPDGANGASVAAATPANTPDF